jgi:hypothetical protein
MNEPRLNCKKWGCERPAARGQVYCSRDHAPYGRLGQFEYDKPPPHPTRKDLAAKLKKIAPDHTIAEAAEKLGVSYSTVRLCAVEFDIEFYSGYQRRAERDARVRPRFKPQAD